MKEGFSHAIPVVKEQICNFLVPFKAHVGSESYFSIKGYCTTDQFCDCL